MAKTKISILLIKDSIVRREDMIRNDISRMTLSNGNVLYYRVMPEREPKWVANFFGDGIPEDIRENNPLKGKSVSAVILYTVTIHIDGENVERTFAICFGHGRSFLKPNVFERRFGLLVTLNAIRPNQLRSVDVNTLDSIPLNSRVQSSNLASIENFNIDIDKDLLKSVAGISEAANVRGLLSGTDSLSLSTGNKYDGMTEILRCCYNLYKSNRYRDNFEWVDQIQAIKDADLIRALDTEMLSKLNAEDAENIWVSLPEIIDWNATDNFRLRSEDEYNDIDIDILKSEYGDRLNTIKRLKSNYIKCVEANGSIIKQWPIYRCIYADIRYNGQQYLLNDGKWFKVDVQFAERINDSYEHVDVCHLDLPDYNTSDTEQVYNANVSQMNPTEFCLMDRRLIPFGGNTIEFCDLYSSDGQIIHVKKNTGSSVLSHLFMQGLVSADSFLDEEFRILVNQRLNNEFSVPERREDFSPSNYEVVYVIATKYIGEDGRPQIPFFSKVSLNTVVKQLRRLKYSVSIQGVKLNQGQQ